MTATAEAAMTIADAAIATIALLTVVAILVVYVIACCDWIEEKTLALAAAAWPVVLLLFLVFYFGEFPQ